MKPGLPKIIEKVRISRYVGSPKIDLHIAVNAVCIDYADTGWSEHVCWRWKSYCMNRSTLDYGCEDTVEFNNGVGWASLPITWIAPQVAQESKSMPLPHTLHNTGWVDHRQVHHGLSKAIPVLYPVDVENAYSYSASGYYCVQWHVRTYRWRYASFT